MTSFIKQFETRFPNFAIPTYHLIAQAQFGQAKAYERLGEVLIAQQRWPQAIDICRLALQRNPNAWSHNRLARALLGANLVPEAIAACESAIAIDPENAWHYHTLGECLIRQDLCEAAIPILQRSIELLPDRPLPEHWWTYYWLGKALVATEQIDAAIAFYQNAVQRFPDKKELQQGLKCALHLQSQQPIDLATLIQIAPKLHKSRGKSTSLAVSNELLYFIDRQVNSDSYTLETGAGLSTVLFAIKQTHHVCIVPDRDLVDRIQEFCLHYRLSTEKITFHVAGSEQILPQLELDELDLVLIDGRHAFPTPFIDWYYTANQLKIGGVAIVDDTKIWTGEVLKNFLSAEAEWQLKDEFPQTDPNAAVFIKTGENSHQRWWYQQPYTQQNSSVTNIIN